MPRDIDDALIAGFYDAALDPSLWPSVLQSLAGRLHGRGAIIIPLSREAPFVQISTDALESAADYAANWWQEDVLLEIGRARKITAGLFDDRDLLTDAVRARHPFYQDFLRAYGIGALSGVVTTPEPDHSYSVSIHRDIKAPPLDADERKAFERLSGHIVRAVAVASRLDTATALNHAMGGALDRFGCAAAVIDHKRTVILANPAFEALRGNGLQVAGRQIRCTRTDQQAIFDTLIGNALATDGGRTPTVSAIRRPNGGTPLLIRAIPVTAPRLEQHFGLAPVNAVLILVIDPAERRDDSDIRPLVQLGLTKAQARLALMIGGGMPPKEAALRLGVSENTVRTTVKNLYDRLGLARQAELAQLVAHIAPLSR